MSDQSNNEHSGSGHEEHDVMSLLKKMQQQLSFLEKKMDTLLSQSQSQARPPREGNFSRPFRPFNRPNRPSGGFGQGGPRQGHGGPRQDHGHRSSEGGFAPKKKTFFGGPRREGPRNDR